MTAIIIISLLIIILAFIAGTYNKLIRLSNKAKQSKQGIDIYLKQRFDLIPNLVECVKAYAKHEKDTLEKVTELRKDYDKDQSLKQGELVNNELNKIIALAESYPEIKASENYLNLQKNLSKMESQLQAARRIYNSDVTRYNIAIQTIPTNIIASLFGFKEKELFEIEESQKENVEVNI